MNKRPPGVEFRYKGKRYFFDFYYLWEKNVRGEKIRPIGEPNNETAEITVKNYKRGNWNLTLNVNGETIIVGWGPYKHLTIWGSIILASISLFFLIWYYLKKYLKRRKEKEIERILKGDFSKKGQK